MKLKALFLWPAIWLVSAAAPFFAAAQVGTPDHNIIRDEGRAPYRTEFISYDIRGEAEKESTHSALTATSDPRQGSKYFRALTFRTISGAASGTFSATFETVVEIPAVWLERDVYLRDTGRTGRYEIYVNGDLIAFNTSTYGVAEYWLTPHLQAGKNRLTLVFDPSVAGAELEKSSPGPLFDMAAKELKNLYIFSQPRIHIFDYQAVGRYDEEFRDMVIDMKIAVVNTHNVSQKITLGFDMWEPSGKLKEYTFREVEIRGRGCDTVRFVSKVTGTGRNKYSAANPLIYKIILSVEQDGRKTEYIPFDFAFLDEKQVEISASEPLDFPDPKVGMAKLKALKKQGKNTVVAARPQSKWFYDATQELGLWVVDTAAVDCDPKDGNRGPQGTVANNPTLLKRFLDRQQAMFFRNRNAPNIVGWSIGAPSGNGYNMYKSYQFLKALDPVKPVVYPGAEGEWNTDELTVAPPPAPPVRPTASPSEFLRSLQ